MTIRERAAAWLLRNHERATPIDFSPGFDPGFFGGIGSQQPQKRTLLHEISGTADYATRAIANRCSAVRFDVKTSTRTSEGTLEDEILDDHPLKALLDRPHPTWSYRQLMRLTSQYIVTVGEGYWLKIRNRAQVPSALQPMPPQNVEPVVNSQSVIDEYIVRDGKGDQLRVQASEVVRFWWPDPETMYTAEGYLAPNARNFDSQTYSAEHLRTFYQRDATPRAVLKAEAQAESMDVEQRKRFANKWSLAYQNRKGTQVGTPALLPPGWDIIFAKIQSGAELVPLLEYWANDQLMNYGVPKSILGMVVSGDRSSAEVNQWVFDQFTVLPIMEMMADALTLALAGEFGDSTFVTPADFVSEDKDFQLKQEANDSINKIRSPQQIITDRGGDDDQTPWGEFPVGSIADVPYTGEASAASLFGTPTSAPGSGDAEPVEDDESEIEPDEPRGHADVEAKIETVKQRMRAYFSRVTTLARRDARELKWVERMDNDATRVFEAQRRAVNSALVHLDKRGLEDQIAELEELDLSTFWETIFEPTRRELYMNVGTATSAALGQAFSLSKAVETALGQQSFALVQNADTTTQKMLRKELIEAAQAGESVGQMAARVDRVFDHRIVNTERIARTEFGKAQISATLESYRQSGVVEKKRWIDSRDIYVRANHHMDAIAVVPIDADFVLPNGATCQGPFDARLEAGDVINCRCDVIPIIFPEDEAEPAGPIVDDQGVPQ